MLSVFVVRPQGLVRVPWSAGTPLPADAVWLDLLEPKPDEEQAVEHLLNVDVPTREEMREIESSNRLYQEDGVMYMTMTIVTKLETDLPESTQVTFILNGTRLITNRYVDPLPFRRFIAYAEKHPSVCTSPATLLAGLLEAVVNRIADVIERVGTDLDEISASVFAPLRHGRTQPRNFRQILERIGQNGDLNSKARESLVSLGRLLAFVQQEAPATQIPPDARMRFQVLSRDVTAMSDHASFLGDKLSFVLDATLGMVTIDQNNILKIFSVVTVFLLPPSVIGAFYGMNFAHIPWLHETWGPWAALGLMIVSSFVPYLIFKRRRWL